MLVPLKERMDAFESPEALVPPFAIGKTPVMSEVRFMSAVDTAPAVALRNPLNVPIVSALDAMRLLVEAVPETVRAVEDA